MLDVIKKLRYILSKRDKQFLLGLVFFSIFIAIVETAGVSVIMPFIAVASDFSLIETNEYYSFFYDKFGFKSDVNFVIGFGIVLIGFYIFRAIVNVIYFHLLARFSQGRYHLLAYRLYQKYLNMPYKEFVNKNSSFLTKSIINEANGAVVLVNQLLIILSEIFVIIFIYTMLVFANWKITLLITLLLLVKVVFLTKTVSKRIKAHGKRRASFQKDLYEVINSTFGNFKIIKLINKNSELENRFKNASFGYADSMLKYQTLNSIPRIFLELVGFGIVVGIVVYILFKYQRDITAVIPLLSIYVLALYRLMPSANRIMSAYNGIMHGYKALEIVYEDLTFIQEKISSKDILFNNKLEIKELSFSFGEKAVLNGISFLINRGESIAFIGESGSGKSTLVDNIIGLYRSDSGTISIDGCELTDNNLISWREKIGYIPQQIYLFDGTVGENVSFSHEYDQKKVEKVLTQAKILEFLKNKEGVHTRVGEGGIQLSGGQKQRIAIARALFQDPEILVLDEATSALDEKVEAEIMDEIYDIAKNKTLIIIAHRLSTIKRCNRVFTLKGGKIVNEQN